MIPNEVVHYTKREIALEHILFEKKILFNQIGKTNDPKETQYWFFPIKIDGITRLHVNDDRNSLDNRDPHDESSRINKIANEVMKDEWKVFCVTKHTRSRKEKFGPNNQVEFEKNIFRYGYSHPRLWAHYGGCHTGVCIIFDGKKLDQNIQKTLSKKCKIFQGFVRYDNKYAISSWTLDVSGIEKSNERKYIREYFFQHYMSRFLIKTIDWESEYEYRWLVHSTTKKPEYVSIDGAIKSVIVGSDFPRVYEESLISLCKGLNIPAGQIKWSNGQPNIFPKCIYAP
jgi:hypothetical protein